MPVRARRPVAVRTVRAVRAAVYVAIFASVAVAVALSSGHAGAQEAPVNDPDPEGPHAFEPDYGPDPSNCFSPLRVPGGATERVYLVLNVAARRLYVYQGGTLAAAYSTAVGRSDHHTPIGRYSILSKAVNPTWYPIDGRPPVPPGPENPLGARWMGWLASGYGLHGTNADWSIGHAVSHGCVRLHNADAEAVFEQVLIGTPFDAVYEPMEIAAFGPLPGVGDGEAPTGRGPAGGFVLTLFPDIYSRVPDYPALLAARLAQAGRVIDPETEAWLLASLSRHGEVTLDTATPVLVGTRQVDTPIIRLGRAPEGVPLLSVRAVAEALGLDVAWDPTAGLPTVGGVAVAAQVVAGRAYATAKDLAAASGINLSWTWEATGPRDGFVRHKLNVYPGLVYVNGAVVSRQAFRVEDGTYVPLKVVAEAFGFPLWWDAATSTVLLNGLAVPAAIVDGRSYVRTDVLVTLLGGRVAIETTPDGVFVARGTR